MKIVMLQAITVEIEVVIILVMVIVVTIVIQVMVLVNILRRSSGNKKVWLVIMEIIIIITCVDAVFGFKRLVPHS